MTSVPEFDEVKSEDLKNVSDTCDKDENEKICGCIPISPESYKGLYQMLNLDLMRDGIFVMFLVSNFFTSIGFNVPYVYTVVSILRI